MKGSHRTGRAPCVLRDIRWTKLPDVFCLLGEIGTAFCFYGAFSVSLLLSLKAR